MSPSESDPAHWDQLNGDRLDGLIDDKAGMRPSLSTATNYKKPMKRLGAFVHCVVRMCCQPFLTSVV